MAKLPVEKMRELERRFGEIEARMSAGPAADVYVKLASEYSELEPVVKKIRAYEAATGEAADLRAMLADKATDREMRDLADMELPEVEARIETLEGEVLALSLLGQDTLVAFLSSGCTTCQEFWNAFRREPELPPGARLVVVTKSPDEESPSALHDRRPDGVPLLMSDETWEAFGVPGSPYFAYVDASGRLLGEGSGASWPQVLSLMQQSRADALARRRASA